MKYLILTSLLLLSACGASETVDANVDGDVSTETAAVEKVIKAKSFGICSTATKDVWDNWPHYASFQTAIDQAGKRVIFWGKDPKGSNSPEISKRADDFSEINLPKGSLVSISVGPIESLSDRGEGSEIYLMADEDAVIVFKDAKFDCRKNG